MSDMTMDTQAAVFEAVKARGYDRDKSGEPWTVGPLVARQVLKLGSEFAELFECIDMPLGNPVFDSLRLLVGQVGEACDKLFKDDKACHTATINGECLGRELPDVVVPALVAASALGIDLDAAAREKATKDIARGVR